MSSGYIIERIYDQTQNLTLLLGLQSWFVSGFTNKIFYIAFLPKSDCPTMWQQRHFSTLLCSQIPKQQSSKYIP